MQLNGLQQLEHEFEPGSVHHLMEPDINQEVYGLPEYLGALHSAWLNESATLFRRKYYENGSHAGFILYMTDAAQSQSDVDKMREALKNSKGPGNFRNLFMYAPNGKKDGIQLIPASEVTAKDEFFNIKNVTRDDLLAAHRVPPVRKTKRRRAMSDALARHGGLHPVLSQASRNQRGRGC